MKLFTCTHCGEILYFENTICAHCGYATGLYEENKQLFALSAKDESSFTGSNTNIAYKYCANHAFDVCNWLVPVNSGSHFCQACALNHTIPNLQKMEYREYWKTIERAKHRLIYSLLRLQLPFPNKRAEPAKGLQFDFVASEQDKKIFTGHENGLITINIAEADDIEREMARKNMHEPYRTVLGHFRHEVGHYYWDMLIDNSPNLPPCRAVFGDDREDYSEALKHNYKDGPPPNWMDNFISTYASSHPWEDWAETWAHYMHIMDTLETAFAYSIQVKPAAAKAKHSEAAITSDPYEEESFQKLITQWLPLTYAINSLNRSMGINDVYPFVIAPRVMKKLEYIHKVCFAAKGGGE